MAAPERPASGGGPGGASGGWPAIGSPAPRQLAIAHRGLHETCPENTLEAFALAVEAGADGVETDVRLSRDNLPVLFHDRNAPGGRAVAELTAAELAAAAGYAVPTLDRALELFPGLLWNVEIKTAAAAPAAAGILAAFASRRRLLVTSFWHPLVPAFRGLGVELGLLLASRPLALAPLLAQLPRDGSIGTLVWDFEVLDPALLAAATREGLRNLAYGAQTLAEHCRCRGLAADGLAGVITDHPGWLREPLEEAPS